MWSGHSPREQCSYRCGSRQSETTQKSARILNFRLYSYSPSDYPSDYTYLRHGCMSCRSIASVVFEYKGMLYPSICDVTKFICRAIQIESKESESMNLEDANEEHQSPHEGAVVYSLRSLSWYPNHSRWHRLNAASQLCGSQRLASVSTRLLPNRRVLAQCPSDRTSLLYI